MQGLGYKSGSNQFNILKDVVQAVFIKMFVGPFS